MFATPGVSWRIRGRSATPSATPVGVLVHPGETAPVVGEQPAQRYPEPLGQARVVADGGVAVTRLDPLNLPRRDAGLLGQVLLPKIAPLSHTGDDTADAQELLLREGADWIFRHTATLVSARALDHDKPVVRVGHRVGLPT